MKRLFLRCLIFEVLVVMAVVAVFRLIEVRLMAGAVAGLIFLALGLYIFVMGFKEPQFRRSKTFAAGCAHLFLSAIPLFLTRFLNYGLEFENVNILGLPGPLFHRVSTGIYIVLLVATLFDLVMALRSERKDMKK